MKTVKIENKITKEQLIAVYTFNRSGNLRYWVNGLFYSDKKFDKEFKIITND